MPSPDVSKFQWTIIGLLLVLALLEAIVHPTIMGYITSVTAVAKVSKPPTTNTGGK